MESDGISSRRNKQPQQLFTRASYSQQQEDASLTIVSNGHCVVGSLRIRVYWLQPVCVLASLFVFTPRDQCELATLQDETDGAQIYPFDC